MKIVFFGTSQLAGVILEALLNTEHKVLSVVTAEDKKQGRGQKVKVSGVKLLAKKKKLKLLQPKTLHDSDFIRQLELQGAELFVVAAYGKILTKQVLQIPKIYAVNLHASVLPKYRGAAPINWAIINGEVSSGVTVFKMNEKMDQGDIILQRELDILPEETSITLTDKLARIGAEAVIESLSLIKSQKVKFIRQNQDCVSFAPRLKKSDGLIDWQDSATAIYNRIRGLQPWPGAFTYLNGKLLKVWISEAFDGHRRGEAGEVLRVDQKKGILMQTGKGHLLITEVQLEGKRRMSAVEFISGHKVEAGAKLANSKS